MLSGTYDPEDGPEEGAVPVTQSALSTTQVHTEAVDAEVPTVSVDRFFDMAGSDQLVYLQRRFDAIQYNRMLRLEGMDGDGHQVRQFTTNLKQVLRALDEPSDPKRGQRGPLLTEVSRRDDELRATRRVKLKDAIDRAEKMRLDRIEAGEEDGGLSLVDLVTEADLFLATAPGDVRAAARGNRSTRETVAAVDRFRDREVRQQVYARMMEATMERVRPTLRRSRSSPGAFLSFAVEAHKNRQLEDLKAECAALREQLEGAAPRPREQELEARIARLEGQVSNQLALVKGLREKLRVMREQHGLCLHNQANMQELVAAAATVEAGPSPAETLHLSRRLSLAGSISSQGSPGSPLMIPRRDSLAARVPPRHSPAMSVLSASSGKGKEARVVVQTLKSGPSGKHAAAVVLEIKHAAHLRSTIASVFSSEMNLLMDIILPPKNAAPLAGPPQPPARKGRGDKRADHVFVACRGTEVGRFVNDQCCRFFFVFPSATDAVRYSVTVQQRLVDCVWNPLLNDIPETAAELLRGSATEYVWRGLRVAIGIELGATLRQDPLLEPIVASVAYPPAVLRLLGGSEAAGLGSASAAFSASFSDSVESVDQEAFAAEHAPVWHMLYDGPAADLAGYLCSIAAGGEVLTTGAVIAALDMEELRGTLNHFYAQRAAGAGLGSPMSGVPIITPWVSLKTHYSGADIVRVTAPRLADRDAALRRDLSSAERVVNSQLSAAAGPLDSVQPPSAIHGRSVTLVGVAMVDAEALRRLAHPRIAQEATRLFFSTVVDAARASNGYPSRVLNRCEAVLLAFEDTIDAIQFGVNIHEHLMRVQWPEQVLVVPQCGSVDVSGEVLFCGPRVRCGLLVCSSTRRRSTTTPTMTAHLDPLTSRRVFWGNQCELVSQITQQAVGGELLVPLDVLPLMTEHDELLGFPATEHCVDIAVPQTDSLLSLFQVFSRRRALAGPYVNRESRLRDEDDKLGRAELDRTLEQQVRLLREKLYEKDQAVRRLDAVIREKNKVIAEIRTDVMKHAHYTFDAQTTLDRLAVNTCPVFEGAFVAISFAGAEELFSQLPSDCAVALQVFSRFVLAAAETNLGRLVTQLPSGIVRVFFFSDAMRAIDFWNAITLGTASLEWPTKLESTRRAGLLKASDLVENLHPNLDQVIWRGFRPIAALDYGRPVAQFNAVTCAYDFLGPELTSMEQMLRCANDGDFLVSEAASERLGALPTRYPAAKLQSYGPFLRFVNAEQRMRVKALRVVYPSHLKPPPSPPPSNIAKCLVVTVQAASEVTAKIIEAFPTDAAVFKRCIERLVVEYNASVAAADPAALKYQLTFTDMDDGIDFIATVHTVLLHAAWSVELRRLAPFSDVYSAEAQVRCGIGARVGAHFVTNATRHVLPFIGLEVPVHAEACLSAVLAAHAHSGETLATEEVFHELMRSVKERSAKIYPDLIGALHHVPGRPHLVHIYQILPMALHYRAVLFLEEDRLNADPIAKAKAARALERREVTRQHFIDQVQRETTLLLTCERSLNPVDDPVRISNRLHTHIREQLDTHRLNLRTCEKTLRMLETISMMSEDRLGLPPSHRGYPYHVHLMLDLMESSRLAQSRQFSKKYAVQLLSGETDDDRDAPGGRTVTTEVSPRVESFKQRMERIKAATVQPEDFVQLHIDVERFASIVELHGMGPEAARMWIRAFGDMLPTTAAPASPNAKDVPAKDSPERRKSDGSKGSVADSEGGEVEAKQLRLLSSMRGAVGMTIDDVNTDAVRESVVANLSAVMYKVLFGS